MKLLKRHVAVLMAIAVSFPTVAAEPEKDQIDSKPIDTHLHLVLHVASF
jgi:hypothetical protein